VGQCLLSHEVSRSHSTTHHSQYDSSGRVISSWQSPIPDNNQHLQQTNIHVPGGFEPTISADEWPQTYVLDRAATGTWQTAYIHVDGTSTIRLLEHEEDDTAECPQKIEQCCHNFKYPNPQKTYPLQYAFTLCTVCEEPKISTGNTTKCNVVNMRIPPSQKCQYIVNAFNISYVNLICSMNLH
jgi:hypothetical protein